MMWEMQGHIKSCCETFGAMVLSETNLGSSGVESKEKKPTEQAAVPGQGRQVPPGDSVHVALRPLKSFPTPALPVAPKEDKGHFSGSGDLRKKSPLDKVWLTSCVECCLSILKHSEVSGRERMGVQVGWRTSVLGQLMVRSVFSALEFKASRCLSPSAFPFPQPCSGGLDFLFTARLQGPVGFSAPTSAPARSCPSSSHLVPTHPLWDRTPPCWPRCFKTVTKSLPGPQLRFSRELHLFTAFHLLCISLIYSKQGPKQGDPKLSGCSPMGKPCGTTQGPDPTWHCQLLGTTRATYVRLERHRSSFRLLMGQSPRKARLYLHLAQAEHSSNSPLTLSGREAPGGRRHSPSYPASLHSSCTPTTWESKPSPFGKWCDWGWSC